MPGTHPIKPVFSNSPSQNSPFNKKIRLSPLLKAVLFINKAQQSAKSKPYLIAAFAARHPASAENISILPQSSGVCNRRERVFTRSRRNRKHSNVDGYFCNANEKSAFTQSFPLTVANPPAK
jgi:hypothetical protein